MENCETCGYDATYCEDELRPCESKCFSEQDDVMAKYRTEPEEFDGKPMLRIYALRDFGYVKAGNKGGLIESETNLSHSGNCWVNEHAVVMDDATVSGNASIKGHARISGSAAIREDARVINNVIVRGNAIVSGHALLYWHAVIEGHATIEGNCQIGGDAHVQGESLVFDNAVIRGHAVILDHAQVYDQGIVDDNAIVCDYARVFNNGRVFDHAMIKACANVICGSIGGDVVIAGDVTMGSDITIDGNAVIKSMRDYIVFKNFWSSGRTFIWTRSNNMWSVGCFRGTGDQLIKKAYADSELSGREYRRVVEYVEAINREFDFNSEPINREFDFTSEPILGCCDVIVEDEDVMPCGKDLREDPGPVGPCFTMS